MNDDKIIETVDAWEKQRFELDKLRCTRRWDTVQALIGAMVVLGGIRLIGLTYLEAQNTYLEALCDDQAQAQLLDQINEDQRRLRTKLDQINEDLDKHNNRLQRSEDRIYRVLRETMRRESGSSNPRRRR